ncbi:MAG: hydrogenase maturation nickel metallochaperone HypA [bacterium]|nr:hydrogenase maturation nickel metallochaperone HypA [bacterium]
MHELSIASNLMDIVKQAVDGQNVSRVTTLRIVIGELSTVVPDCLAFAFEIMSKGTVAEGAHLDFEKKPLIGKCGDCGREFRIQDFVFHCPDCDSPRVEILSGKEFMLKSIECE